MKNLFKILCLCLCVALIGSCIVGCSNETAEEKPLTYVSLRINPEVELVVEDETVVAVNPVNEDGEILLTQIEDAIGKSVDEICEEVTKVATEMGYIDVDGEEVNVNLEVSGEKAEKVKEIKEKIEKRVNKFFTDCGIFGKVKEEMHETYAEIEEIATANNISMHEAKIVCRILEVYPEMALEEVLALSVKERIELLKDNKNFGHITAEFKDEYKEAVDAVKAKYDEMFNLEEIVEGLKAEIEKTDITDEQKALIQAEIDSVMDQIKALRDAFKAEVDALKDGFKQVCELKKAEHKVKAEEKLNQHKEKFDKHLEEVELNKEQIKDEIESWRKNFSENKKPEKAPETENSSEVENSVE